MLTRNKSSELASETWADSDEIVAYGWVQKRGDFLAMSWPRRFLVCSRKGLTYFLDTDANRGFQKSSREEGEEEEEEGTAPAEESGDGAAVEESGEEGEGGDGEEDETKSEAEAEEGGGEEKEGEKAVRRVASKHGVVFAEVVDRHGEHATPSGETIGIGEGLPSERAVARLFLAEHYVRGRVAVEDVKEVVEDGASSRFEVQLVEGVGAPLRLDAGSQENRQEWCKAIRYSMAEYAHAQRSQVAAAAAALAASSATDAEDVEVEADEESEKEAGEKEKGGKEKGGKEKGETKGKGLQVASPPGRFLTKVPSMRSGPAKRERIERDVPVDVVDKVVEEEGDDEEEEEREEGEGGGEKVEEEEEAGEGGAVGQEEEGGGEGGEGGEKEEGGGEEEEGVAGEEKAEEKADEGEGEEVEEEGDGKGEEASKEATDATDETPAPLRVESSVQMSASEAAASAERAAAAEENRPLGVEKGPVEPASQEGGKVPPSSSRPQEEEEEPPKNMSCCTIA